MVYFEQRDYTRAEMAELLNVKLNSSHFKRDIETKLKHLGFERGRDYSFPERSQDITILWIPQTPSEKIKYLVRLLGIDTHVNPYSFALFLYGMIVT